MIAGLSDDSIPVRNINYKLFPPGRQQFVCLGRRGEIELSRRFSQAGCFNSQLEEHLHLWLPKTSSFLNRKHLRPFAARPFYRRISRG